MTNNEFVAAAQEVINQWEQKGYNPPNLARTEHNANCMVGGIYDFAIANKRMPTAEEVRDVIIKSRNDLEYIQLQPEPVNPADNLPHENIPELRNIRTIIDVQNLSAADARRFLQPGAPKKEFEERVAYIRKHEIFESTKPYVGSRAQTKSSEDGRVAQARTLVNNLKISDIGGSTSAANGGKWTQLRKKQDQLNKTIDSAVQRKVAPRSILEFIQEQISTLGSRSIG